nr:hypothetical protein [Mesorhizobium sp. 131-2-1]
MYAARPGGASSDPEGSDCDLRCGDASVAYFWFAPPCFVAFDILDRDGEDLRSLPAIERKAILWEVVKPAKGIIQYSEHVEANGAAFFAAADNMGLEGIVSKRRSSPYRSGPSDGWVETKCWEVGDFDLLGSRREPGKAPQGIMARGGKYAGSATVALTKEKRERLWDQVRKGRSPPPGLPKAISKAEWLKPGITARVRYLRGEPKLRHATVEDVRAEAAENLDKQSAARN